MEKVNVETERVTLGLYAEQRHQLCAGYQCKVKTTACLSDDQVTMGMQRAADGSLLE